ncbi:MAG: membrane protein insertase YidC [Paludibacteraceae bacterium]|nr:membrane protein insertase YidC [Paludibacteraceae bacterium]
MDKNTIIGFILIALILFGFSWWQRPSEEEQERQRAYNDSLMMAAAEQEAIREAEYQMALAATDSANSTMRDLGVFTACQTGSDSLFVLENEQVKVEISAKGGTVVSAEMKQYTTYDKLPLVLFDQDDASLNFTLVTSNNRVVETAGLYFQPHWLNDSTLSMEIELENGGLLAFEYRLPKEGYRLDWTVRTAGLFEVLSSHQHQFDAEWNFKLRQQERSKTFEGRYSGLYYKYINDDVENLKTDKDQHKDISGRLRWIACKDQFFSTVLVAKEGFDSPVLQSEISKDSRYLKNFESTFGLDYDVLHDTEVAMSWYFLPNKYSLLKSVSEEAGEYFDLEFNKLINLGWTIFGWVNRWFIIPLFDFLSRYISNYGIIILLLTLIVKIVLFPFTYKSYMSTAKMRVLRPMIDEINEKISPEKSMERQQATMDLYNKAGVSPMGGCLPMLLQMPILFALFIFFPTAFELRGQSFLWAADLSSYDAIFSWDTYIPLISRFYGNHVSLFCLLMAITNIISTKITNDANASSAQMPGMKVMMYLMPVMFLGIFNDYASGLCYYYFISSLITILQNLIFRWSINDEKMLAQLRENMKKPRKKSKFQQRLEEMQKQQRAMQQTAAKQKK